MTPAPRRRTITASRTERQFALSPSVVAPLASAIRAHLPCTLGDGGGLLVTTIYLDDEDGTHLAGSVRPGPSDRLRLREYPGPKGGSHAYYIERKRHFGTLTEKVRRRVEASEAAALLANRRWAGAAFASLAPEIGNAALTPVLVVQYHRQTFAGEECRVTIDRAVTYFRPPGAIAFPLASPLTLPVACEPGATLETKVAGLGPSWLQALCEPLPLQPSSKFVRGCHALASAAAARATGCPKEIGWRSA